MCITSYSIRIVLLSRYVNIYDTMAPMSNPWRLLQIAKSNAVAVAYDVAIVVGRRRPERLALLYYLYNVYEKEQLSCYNVRII